MLKFTGQTVVVPWDFSEMSLSALRTALAMVDQRNQVKVVHVGQVPTSTEPSVIWDTITEQSIQQFASDKFNRLIAENPEIAGVELTTLFGDPGIAIADFARDVGADLVIISSHGRTGFSRLLLGSVAERVVRLSPVPVLVLRGSEKPKGPVRPKQA